MSRWWPLSLLVCIMACAHSAKPTPTKPPRLRLVRPPPPDASDLSLRYEPTGPGVTPGDVERRRPGREIVSTLEEHWSDLQRCYEVGTASGPASHQFVTVKFTIFADGSVADANPLRAIDGSALPSVAACVARAVAALRFDPVEGGRVQVVLRAPPPRGDADAIGDEEPDPVDADVDDQTRSGSFVARRIEEDPSAPTSPEASSLDTAEDAPSSESSSASSSAP